MILYNSNYRGGKLWATEFRGENKNTSYNETLTFAVVISKTRADDGKTLTFAAGTQSSLVAAESERVRSGVVFTAVPVYLPSPKKY